VLHFPESGKPDPIVPKPFIAEVSERVDCKGQVVVELNEEEAEAAIRRLTARGVEAIAICFLWSFKHPEHERRVKAMVERLAPGVFVCCSADLIPRWGGMSGWRDNQRLPRAVMSPTGRWGAARGGGLRYRSRSCNAGRRVPAPRRAARVPHRLGAGGALASQYLGHRREKHHHPDMGGTSFDVGLVHDGRPVASYQSVVNQYEYFVPRIDIRSIGSGGGSIIWVDETSGSLRVGPHLGRRRSRTGLLRPRRTQPR
jgi:N-methylhydantoinase A